MKLVLLLCFFSSFVITFVLIPFLINLAKKLCIVDVPDGKLKKHSYSVAYLGGIGVFLGLLIPFFILGFEHNIYLILLMGLFSLTCLGLWDDILVINPLTKIIGQSFASIFLVCATKCFNIFPFHFINLSVSFFWILSIINAFNLIDVMDGLTSFVSIFSSLFFLFFAILFNQLSLAIILASFLGAMVAFCYYNFPPAKIYLGDSGSLFIGGFLATVPLMLNWKLPEINIFFISCVILSIPILELVFLIIIRLYKKIPFYLGSPDHFSIYLKNKGWSKIFILFYIAIISMILFLISSLFFFNYIGLIGLFSFIILLFTFWFYFLLF